MKEIQLTQGKVTLIDDEDFEKVNQFKWYYLNVGYAVRSVWINNKCNTILLHRYLLGLKKGDSIEVDHIDGNKLNNIRYNLRECTGKQNKCNKLKLITNTSGYKGVYWHKGAQKWCAQIATNGIHVYLGLYSNLNDAAFAYDNAALKYHGKFANLNLK